MWTTYYDVSGGWRHWSPIPHGDATVKMHPRATITAIAADSEGRQTFLFTTDTNGVVWSSFATDHGAWTAWSAIRPQEFITGPGAKVATLSPFEGHIDIFATRADGTVWSTFRENDVWQPWFPIGSNQFRIDPGATITAFSPYEGHVDIFATATDGTVWTAFFDANTGWRDWFGLTSEPIFKGPVSSLAPYAEHADLFATDITGTVWSTFREGDGQWQRWVPIGAGVKMHPGSAVTPLRPFEGHVDLFAMSADGVVWTTYFEDGQGWREWYPIRPETARFGPGATVAAVSPREGRVDIFAVADGIVWTTAFDADSQDVGWGPWEQVDRDRLRVAPESRITAIVPFTGHIDLFVVGAHAEDPTGAVDVWTTFRDEGAAWHQWFTPSPVSFGLLPGTTVAALTPFEGHVDVFAVDATGAVWSTFFQDGSWRAWFTIHEEHRMHPGANISVLSPREGRVDIFTTTSDGTVWRTCFTNEEAVWRPWSSLDTPAGLDGNARTTALLMVGDHTAVFATGQQGQIWVTRLKAESLWPTWFTIGTQQFAPGATVTPSRPFPGHVDLYVTDGAGMVWSTYYEPESGWISWFPISGKQMHPGAEVTLCQRSERRVELYASASDGTVLTTSFDADQGVWAPWVAVHGDRKMHPGARITLLLDGGGAGLDELFAIDANGYVWTARFDEAGKWWAPWSEVNVDAAVRMAPGGAITAERYSASASLFTTDLNGLVHGTFRDDADAGGWHRWESLHSELKAVAGSKVGVTSSTINVASPDGRWRLAYTSMVDRSSWSVWTAPPLPRNQKVASVRSRYTDDTGYRLYPDSDYVIDSDGTVWKFLGKRFAQRQDMGFPWASSTGSALDPICELTAQVLDETIDADGNDHTWATHFNLFGTDRSGRVRSTWWKEWTPDPRGFNWGGLWDLVSLGLFASNSS
ncbi:hypothetical protein [Cellulomonas cellasea]|uniref:hypothetical protein n=1 Tax=Cellulomonas cellasea TaxID=43670 RepID=UPI001142DB38|nr:hypothetical protein [Cellulomonas cellasea]